MAFSRLLRLALFLFIDVSLLFGDEPANVDFGRDIRPLLADRCFHCHGPDESTRMADLRLDDWQAAGSVIIANEPDSSELIRRIQSDDPLEVMPPPEENKPLTGKEIQLLKDWIQQGAVWVGHWAYELPKRWPLPTVHFDEFQNWQENVPAREWPLNWIDYFILAGLQRSGLQPSPMSDSDTLRRRLSFDLIGLPSEHGSAGHGWQGEEHYLRQIDLLLSSPHHGERMASYWLDLVRYADTVGYHGDQDHHISAYRDWVIDAFNNGYPFDAMTRDQLAGDLLDQPTLEQRIATGYNRVLQTTHEGGLQPGEYRAIYAADRVRNLTDVWLAASVGCAQCHDHKFDPYTMRDFYSLAAFFADIDDEAHFKTGTNSLPTSREPEIELPTQEQAVELSILRRQIDELDDKLGSQLAPDQNEEVARERQKVHRQLQRLQATIRRSMITVALESPRETRILPRGDWMDDSGELVNPAFPEFLRVYSPDSSFDRSSQRLNRLDLAQWLSSTDDGIGLLTARVIVNRLWYLFFGRGLSSDLADFGGQGVFPTHLELLDNLAHHLVDHEWDLKATIRLIVSSRTYRQSSVATGSAASDPDNSGFGRQSAFRLPAEMIRDNALAVSDLLVREVGGGVSRPYQPAGYYRHLNFPIREYQADADQQQWRRGVYVHWQRQFLHPMLKAFDASNREECTAQRDRSNTPLAALVLLNDPTFVEAARALAERMLTQTQALPNPSDALRVEWLFTAATGRKAHQAEIESLCRLLDSSRNSFADNPENAQALLTVGILPARVDLAPNELAAWAEVSRAILNLAKTTMRQ